jgi:hypothetical protein
MSLIRFGFGSELYIYEGMNGSYTCCACPIDDSILTLPNKAKIKEHILLHKDLGHSIGIAGNTLTYQSYDELLEAVDKN